MHIPTFKMSIIVQVLQLIHQGDYAFSIDLKDAYLHIPILKHHTTFYSLFGNKTLSVEGFAICTDYISKGFHLSHKTQTSLPSQGFPVIIYLDISGRFCHMH